MFCSLPAGKLHNDVRFSYNFQEWLDHIEQYYFDERDDLVRQSLQTALDNVRDPFGFILHVIHKGFFDLYSKRIPLQYLALDEMSIWLDLKVYSILFVVVLTLLVPGF